MTCLSMNLSRGLSSSQSPFRLAGTSLLFCDVAIATATVLLAPHWLRHFLGHGDVMSAAITSALISSVLLSAFAIRHSLFALLVPVNAPALAQTIASLSGMAALVIVGRGSSFLPGISAEWILEGGSLAIFASRLIRFGTGMRPGSSRSR